MQSWADIAESEQEPVQTCISPIQPEAQPLNIWANYYTNPAVAILVYLRHPGRDSHKALG